MSHENPPTLEYRPPQDDVRPPMFSTFGFVVSLFFCAVVFVNLSFVVPRFEQIFKDFGTTLPAMTLVLLNVSRWFVRAPWTWAFLGFVPIFIGLLLPRQFPMPIETDPKAILAARIKRVRRTTRIVMLFLFIFLGFMMVALALPMFGLIQAVSSPRK